MERFRTCAGLPPATTHPITRLRDPEMRRKILAENVSKRNFSKKDALTFQ